MLIGNCKYCASLKLLSLLCSTTAQAIGFKLQHVYFDFLRRQGGREQPLSRYNTLMSCYKLHRRRTGTRRITTKQLDFSCYFMSCAYCLFASFILLHTYICEFCFSKTMRMVVVAYFDYSFCFSWTSKFRTAIVVSTLNLKFWKSIRETAKVEIHRRRPKDTEQKALCMNGYMALALFSRLPARLVKARQQTNAIQCK